MKTRIQPITLKHNFPSDDPVAASVARLCILREDFFLELMGFTSGPIKDLDQNTSEWRQLYFFRMLFRTLIEIRSAIQKLHEKNDFKKILETGSPDLRKDIQTLNSSIESIFNETKELRNKISGHIKHGAVEDALKTMLPFQNGLIQVSDDPMKVHFRFVDELVGEIMFPACSVKQKHSKFKDLLAKLEPTLYSVMRAIDSIYLWYITSRGLNRSGYF